MSFIKKFSQKLGKALTVNEMRQVKGGDGYGSCGVCNGEYVRPNCVSDDNPITGPGLCYCGQNQHYGCW